MSEFTEAISAKPSRDHGTLGPVAKKVASTERRRRRRYINIQLKALGLPAAGAGSSAEDDFLRVAQGVIENYREMTRLLADHRAPVDQRIENYLNSHFADLNLDTPLRLPSWTYMCDQHGLARELSIPAAGTAFHNDIVSSYRLANGVLNNPKSDRRTTKGTFHVTAGGLPVPADKREVPRRTFVNLYRAALQPPESMLVLPYTSDLPAPAKTFVSLFLRPIVCPEVPGYCTEKSMEVRFFAPGALVSNLDFVESIFGNAGDPYIPSNDSALDIDHWTGHTGCVILAPHLVTLKKKDLGLPHIDQATPRQRHDRMCWSDPDELYNDGVAFKLTCRTQEGVIVTLIADNYYGYCKKEVKTQISYAANLYGGVEEEHAGGAIAFASYNLGDDYIPRQREKTDHTFAEVCDRYADQMKLMPDGYAVDTTFPNLIYVDENSTFSLSDQEVSWPGPDGERRLIPLEPEKVYMLPSGYKVQMKKHPGAPSWRLTGTIGRGVFCHKPCTVSGGGKSEISKSIVDYMYFGPIFVKDIEADFKQIDEIFNKDYSKRWRQGVGPNYADTPSRPLLSEKRSVGSVVKLLTPSSEYNDEFNDWLEKIPSHVYAMLLIIKRFYKEEMGANWREHFGVDIVNGAPSHELKYKGRDLRGTYLRVGYKNGRRVFKVRQDFAAAEKVQMEDDISASVVVPTQHIISVPPTRSAPSHKFLVNCEYRLFQRPDDAILRGVDKQTEWDLAQANNFISNFEPLTKLDIQAMLAKVVEFEKYTAPMQGLLRRFAAPESDDIFVVSSSQPRIVDGEVSKNPRYLQDRPDLVRPFETYVANMGLRLWNRLEPATPVMVPVDAVLFGRRNNRPEADIRGLSVYSPIHYQELPELFMDFFASLSGKSPSTTGAGSEGALTKGPFNALRLTADMNTALVSYILTDLHGFSTPAGWIGTEVKVDHDISLLIPEIWCRLSPEERNPHYMLEQGYLEPVENMTTADGRVVPSGRLGYRITDEFLRRCFGRVFDTPTRVFEKSLLRPELQDRDAFLDSVLHIAEGHQRVAQQLIDDGSVKEACPPLQELLYIMAEGPSGDHRRLDPKFREMFTRKYMLESDWYRKRLQTKQKRDIRLWERHVAYLESVSEKRHYQEVAASLELPKRLDRARQMLAKVRSQEYFDSLVGTLGADPMEESSE